MCRNCVRNSKDRYLTLLSPQCLHNYMYMMVYIIPHRAFLNKSEGQGGNRKGVFQVAVPIKLALRHKKKESVKVLLHCTNCNRYQKEIEWRKLALGEVDPSWLEDIDWVTTVPLKTIA